MLVFVELWGRCFSCYAKWEHESQMVKPESRPLSPRDLWVHYRNQETTLGFINVGTDLAVILPFTVEFSCFILACSLMNFISYMEVSSEDPQLYSQLPTHKGPALCVCVWRVNLQRARIVEGSLSLARHYLSAFRFKTNKESTEIIKIKTKLEFHFVLCDHLEILFVLKM